VVADEEGSQYSAPYNSDNTVRNDSRPRLQHSCKLVLRDKVVGLATSTCKIKSIPRLRPINAACVPAGTRRITETRPGKQDEDGQRSKNSFFGNKVVCGPSDRQDRDR